MEGVAQNIVDEIIKDAYEVIKDGVITINELIVLGGSLAQKVGYFQTLSGSQKQELIIYSIKAAIQKVLKEKEPILKDEVFADLKQKLQMAEEFAKNTLPTILSLIVVASRGQIQVDHTQKAQGCIQQLLSCFGKTVQVLEPPKKLTLIELPQKKESSTEVVADASQVPVELPGDKQ